MFSAIAPRTSNVTPIVPGIRPHLSPQHRLLDAVFLSPTSSWHWRAGLSSACLHEKPAPALNGATRFEVRTRRFDAQGKPVRPAPSQQNQLLVRFRTREVLLETPPRESLRGIAFGDAGEEKASFALWLVGVNLVRLRIRQPESLLGIHNQLPESPALPQAIPGTRPLTPPRPLLVSPLHFSG
jgi:hypothetical protein